MTEDPDRIDVWVAGECVPKGSTKSFYIKKLNRVVTTNGNKKTSAWEMRIAHECQAVDSVRERTFFNDDKNESYTVTCGFVFSLPKSFSRKNRDGTIKKYAMTKRPDLDKLIRTVLDAITDVLIPDDAQVTFITIGKEYIGERCPAPGVMVTVQRGLLRGH